MENNKEIKPMNLEVYKYMYVGCIPVYACPEPPNDQSPCIKQDCPHCNREMWVSEKKRNIKKCNPKKVKIYCLECLAVGAMNQGYEPELLDIGKIQ